MLSPGCRIFTGVGLSSFNNCASSCVPSILPQCIGIVSFGSISFKFCAASFAFAVYVPPTAMNSASGFMFCSCGM